MWVCVGVSIFLCVCYCSWPNHSALLIIFERSKKTVLIACECVCLCMFLRYLVFDVKAMICLFFCLSSPRFASHHFLFFSFLFCLRLFRDIPSFIEHFINRISHVTVCIMQCNPIISHNCLRKLWFIFNGVELNESEIGHIMNFYWCVRVIFLDNNCFHI